MDINKIVKHQEANNITADVKLPDEVLEKLYQSYSIKQKRPGLGCFLAASILFGLWAILVPQGQSWESLGLYLYLVYCILFKFYFILYIFNRYHLRVFTTKYTAWIIFTIVW